MSDLFSDFREEFEEADQPDYSFFEEEDDTFDQLRQRSARSGSAFDEEMEWVDDDEDNSGGRRSTMSLGNFTPGQRVILALLFVLDIVMVLIGFLIMTGRIG